jgi:hypothetical protein
MRPWRSSATRSFAWAIISTWVYNNTAGGLLMAVLLHATVNFTPTLFVSPVEAVNFYLVFAGLMCVAAFIVVAIAGPTHLARQRAVASQRTTRVRCAHFRELRYHNVRV